MVATVLHLDKGTHMPIDMLDHLRSRVADAHDIVDAQLLLSRNAEVWKRAIGGGAELLLVAEHHVDLGPSRQMSASPSAPHSR